MNNLKSCGARNIINQTAKCNQPKLFILPNCWFSRQAIDQYSPLLYYTYWGFFRPNVIDRPLSLDYGISGQLNHYFNYYLSETFIVLAKRKVFLLIVLHIIYFYKSELLKKNIIHIYFIWYLLTLLHGSQNIIYSPVHHF